MDILSEAIKSGAIELGATIARDAGIALVAGAGGLAAFEVLKKSFFNSNKLPPLEGECLEKVEAYENRFTTAYTTSKKLSQCKTDGTLIASLKNFGESIDRKMARKSGRRLAINNCATCSNRNNYVPGKCPTEDGTEMINITYHV